MLQRGVKFEIEALSVHNISFLSDHYLPSKIESELTTGKLIGDYQSIHSTNMGLVWNGN